MDDLQRIKHYWKRDQDKLRSCLVTDDTAEWQEARLVCNCPAGPCTLPNVHLRYCGGVDISFVKNDGVNACASLVVLDARNSLVVYKDCQMVQLTAPYIAGYLAFREVQFFINLLSKLQKELPAVFPQVVLVDGNGLLHPRMFGVACHLGVLANVPTIGVAKKLLHVDGLEADKAYHNEVSGLAKAGDSFPLVGASGQVLGVALKSTADSTKPVFVSVGHKIRLETAIWVVTCMTNYRVPEPVRKADIMSREYLRTHWLANNKTTAGNSAAGGIPTASAGDQSFLHPGVSFPGYRCLPENVRMSQRDVSRMLGTLSCRDYGTSLNKVRRSTGSDKNQKYRVPGIAIKMGAKNTSRYKLPSRQPIRCSPAVDRPYAKSCSMSVAC